LKPMKPAANFGLNTISKIRASDGAPLGAFVVQESPTTVVFDGANIWVSGSDTVSKVRPADGVTLASYAVKSVVNMGSFFLSAPDMDRRIESQ
jgi:hypothetical protein